MKVYTKENAIEFLEKYQKACEIVKSANEFDNLALVTKSYNDVSLNNQEFDTIVELMDAEADVTIVNDYDDLYVIGFKYKDLIVNTVIRKGEKSNE